MASNHLTFKIGSTFSGEGFKQARKSVTEANQAIKRSVSDCSQLAAAVGQMDTSMAKAMGACTGMIQAFMSLNVTTIAVQGAMMALNLYTQKVNEEMEALTKRSQELKRACDAAFSATINANVKVLQNEVRTLSSEFDAVAKHANDYASAVNGVRAASAKGGVLELQVQMLNEMIAADSEAEREKIQQTYELREAEMRAVQIQNEANNRAQAAADLVAQNAEKRAAVEAKADEIAARRQELEQALAENDDLTLEKKRQYQAMLDEYQAKEAELRTQDEALRKEGFVLAEKKKEADLNALNTEIELEKQSAERSLMMKRRGEQEFEQMQAEAREHDDQLALFLKNGEAVEEGIEKQKELNDALEERTVSLRDLVAAEQAYRSALGSYAEAQSASLGNTGIGDGIYGLMKSGALPVEIVKAMSVQVADAKVDDAIRNGTVNTVKDADRMRREEARAARDAMNKDSGTRAQEAQKYERLLKQNADSLSKQDKDFMTEYGKIRAAAEAQRKAVEDAKEKTAESAKAIKEIKDQLKNLTAS